MLKGSNHAKHSRHKNIYCRKLYTYLVNKMEKSTLPLDNIFKIKMNFPRDLSNVILIECPGSASITHSQFKESL